ncbi:MAG: ABC transporter permease [Enterocloster sp.]
MKSNGRWKKIIKTMFARKVAVFSSVVVVLFILMAVLAPVISPYDPNYADFAAFLQGPSSAHLLGTDNYGRDVLSRIIYGTRVSLIIGVLAVAIACAIGTFFGMVAGYFGGIVDDVITRIMEAVRAIPQIILAMALTAVFGSGIRNLAIILGISSMAGYVRMMRGQVLTIKQADYIMAGKLQGNKDFRLMFKHILPNSISPIIVMMTQQVGSTILAEAGLSFLGLGISAPTASWGSMVSEGRMYLMQNPVFALTPGICVAVLVICLNMFGDGVRDALDPRLRGEV